MERTTTQKINSATMILIKNILIGLFMISLYPKAKDSYQNNTSKLYVSKFDLIESIN